MLAMAAAVLLGTGFVLQQRVAERAPKAYFLHLRLLGDLVRKPRWLVGVAAMGGGPPRRPSCASGGSATWCASRGAWWAAPRWWGAAPPRRGCWVISSCRSRSR